MSAFVTAFNFAEFGETATTRTPAQQPIHRQISAPDAGGECRQAERRRSAGALFRAQGADPHLLLRGAGRPGLAQVVRTALACPIPSPPPTSTSRSSCSRRSSTSRISPIPEKLGKFLTRFTSLWEISNPTSPAQTSRQRAVRPAGRSRHLDRPDDRHPDDEVLRTGPCRTALYVALSSQIALEKRLTRSPTTSPTLRTVGFRATEREVRGRRRRRSAHKSRLLRIRRRHLSSPDSNGPLRETGNPFDFAIQGDAWFGIDTPAGTVMTRDGRFTMTDTRRAGHASRAIAVLDAGGAPIQLDPRNGAPKAGADGVAAPERPAGRRASACSISIRGRTSSATAIPASFPPGEPEPVVDRIDVGVAQGFLEESNVNPVLEMTRLIMVQRAFENARGDDPRHRIVLRRSHQDARLEIAASALDGAVPAAVALAPERRATTRSTRWSASGVASPTSARWSAAAAASPRCRRRTTGCAVFPAIARLGDIVEQRGRMPA